ncbi:MAG: ATP-binding cassette domain-containing protein [Betaproteobacteria bacterium]|nr:ATP-binding cassette domain-containing protein [Betaproteobacteria bacterium]
MDAAALRRLLELRGQRVSLTDVQRALEQAGEPQFAGGSEALSALSAALGSLGTEKVRLAATRAEMLSERHLPALVEYQGRTWVLAEARGPRRLLDSGEGSTREVEAADLDQAFAIWFDRPAHAEERDRNGTRHSAARLLAGALAVRGRILVEVALATLLTSLLAVAISLFALQVYDRVIPSFSHATLHALAGVVGVLIVFDFVLRLVRARLLDRVSAEVDEEVSATVFRALIGVRLDARPGKVGTLAAQVAGLESARAFFASSVLFTIAEVPFALLFIAIIAFIAGPIAWFYGALALGALVAGLAAYAKLDSLSREQLEAGFRRNGLLVESIQGAETIKALGATWRFSERWREATKEIAAMSLRARTAMVGAATVAQSLASIAYVAVVVMGVYLVESGSLTVGALIACTMLGARVIGPIANGVALITQAQQAAQSLRAVDAVLDLPPEREHGVALLSPASLGHELVVEGARFCYGNVPVPQLDVPALRIAEGERVVLLGPPGSGKSTLLKILSGLYRPSQGRMLLGGVDVALLDPELVRRHVGYLPQDVQLFRGTLRENLDLEGTVSDDLLLQVVRELGLDALVRDHPRGLDREIFEGGSGLSGGQRQMAGIARLLLRRPSVLLLDEPTGALDHMFEARALRAIVNCLGPRDTFMLATHRTAALPLASRVIVVQQGRIVLDGEPGRVLKVLQAHGERAGQCAAPNAAVPA